MLPGGSLPTRPTSLALVAGVVVVVMIGVVVRGLQARSAFRMLGLSAPLGALIGMSASSYAANKVVKAGGVAGAASYINEARRRRLSRSHAVGAYVAVRLSDTVALCGLIVGAVVLGAAAGILHGVMLLAALAGLVYGLGLLGGLFAMTRSRDRFDRLLAGPRWVVQRGRRLVGRAECGPEPSAGDDLYAAIATLRADPRRALPVVAAALAGKLVGACGLFAVLWVVGIHLGVATTLLIFTLVLLASAIGPLPAGLGTTEASLGALLLTYGVAASPAAAAVLLFRLLDLWLPLGVGAVAVVLRARSTDVHASDPVPALAVAA